MSRLEEAWGAGDVDTLFNENPITSSPFPRASRLKHVQDYDSKRVLDAVHSPDLHDFDPRELHGTQPSVTRAGVQHYIKGDNGLYSDPHQPGNRHPVVYQRDDGQNLLLSGHHRATAALLQGKQFRVNLVSGPYGRERAGRTK